MNPKVYARLKNPFFYAAILGGVKLVLEAFGVSIIQDEQINMVANGLAALADVIGTMVGYKTIVSE